MCGLFKQPKTPAPAKIEAPPPPAPLAEQDDPVLKLEESSSKSTATRNTKARGTKSLRIPLNNPNLSEPAGLQING